MVFGFSSRWRVKQPMPSDTAGGHALTFAQGPIMCSCVAAERGPIVPRYSTRTTHFIGEIITTEFAAFFTQVQNNSPGHWLDCEIKTRLQLAGTETRGRSLYSLGPRHQRYLRGLHLRDPHLPGLDLGLFSPHRCPRAGPGDKQFVSSHGQSRLNSRIASSHMDNLACTVAVLVHIGQCRLYSVSSHVDSLAVQSQC